MFVDANASPRGVFDRVFDLCVIGSGPAGMTVARSVAAHGFEVALMEAGGFEVSGESQDHYAGEIAGIDYLDLDVVRLRCFGGSSGHWAGRCGVLDAHDFAPLPHRPAGWPITKADLDPYQAAAAEILDVAEPEELPDLAVAQYEDRFRQLQLRYSRPATRLGEKYRDEIAASRRITVCLNANLVDLGLGDDLATVTEAVFRSYAAGDPGFAVRARKFCLCLGGLETPRMLLNFRSQKPAGIGNDHDGVGRYFCEHPTLSIADVIFTEEPQFQQGGEAPVQNNFAPTLAFMNREQILNFALTVEPAFPTTQALGQALLASAKCAAPFTERLAESVLGPRAPTCRWGGLVDEYLMRRHPDRRHYGRVRIAIEESLIPESRVMLADSVDDFGLRRLRLDWRLGDIDYRTMRTAILAFGSHMAEQDTGRLRVRDWVRADSPSLPANNPHESNGGLHHMCTTRMSDDPQEGVVDGDCRVHGTGNLYIGGSSVFATPGFANPTYTIVQLALRLGDHIGRRLTA